MTESSWGKGASFLPSGVAVLHLYFSTFPCGHALSCCVHACSPQDYSAAVTGCDQPHPGQGESCAQNALVDTQEEKTWLIVAH